MNEVAWISISDGVTRMLHADFRLSKASPIKWLESFLTAYSPECKEKFVVLNQSGELYKSVEVQNLFSRFKYIILLYLPVVMLLFKVVLWNDHIVLLEKQ